MTLRRYYFLDESDDPGFDVANGASSHYVLALVRLPGRSSIPEMKALRQKLHLRETFEFKFHRLTSQQKQSFFAAMSQVEFLVRVAVYDKTYISPRWRAMASQQFMVEAICELVMRTPAREVVDDVLIIDGAGPSLRRSLRVGLSAMSRQLGRGQPFKKIVEGNSQNEDGRQLADMIAGAAREYATRQNNQYLSTLAKQDIDLWQPTL